VKQRRRSQLRSYVPEYATEVVIILLSLGLFGFIKLTEEVIEGETKSFDRQVLLWFRDSADLADPVGPAWFEVVMRDMTALGGLFILGLLTVAACGYLMLKRRHFLALYVSGSVLTGLVLNLLLKGFFTRPRPELVPQLTSAAHSSFPSGHAMMSAIVFLTLGALLSLATEDTRIKLYILAWSILLTLLVGISRVYLGVHWPTDIIAGWVAGAIWALLCLMISHWISTKMNRPISAPSP
jgi:undecaprenyl-diphosphatase